MGDKTMCLFQTEYWTHIIENEQKEQVHIA